MNLAISNIAWNKDKDLKVYNLLSKYGFTGLEVAPSRLLSEPYSRSHYEIKKVKKNIIENGLKIVSLQSLHFGKDGIKLFGTEKERDGLFQYTKEAIEFASKLGVPTMVFGSPKLRVINSWKDEYQIAIDFFRSLGKIAGEFGVKLCIEANPVEYKTNFINTTKEATQFARDVDVEGFKINLDLSTMILNKENCDVIIEAGELIQHVHISEPFLESINRDNKSFHYDVKEALKSIKYNKWISIEMRKVSEESNIDNVEKSLKYVKDVFGG